MGVQQFSEVLASAGRLVNLRSYKQGIRPLILPNNHNNNNNDDDNNDDSNDFQRPLRIGIDISSWIAKACQGYSDMLGDERHLTNYGRATLLQQQQQQQQRENSSPNNNNNNNTTRTTLRVLPDDQVLQYVTRCATFCLDRLKTLRDTTNAELLVVFDGKSPPVKQHTVRERSQKRFRAQQERDEPVRVDGDNNNNNNNNNNSEARRIRAFRQAGAGKYYHDVVSHVMLALRENCIAFLVAPYESDGQLAFLSLYNYIDLVVTEDSDLAAYGASPILYKLPDALGKDGEPRGILFRRQDLGANPGKLNLLDFSPVMMAVMFVAAGSDYCRKLKGIGIVGACSIVREAFLVKRKKDPLAFVFERLFSQCWESSNMTENDKKEYKKNFLEALLMFRHPVVYDPVNACCVTVGDAEGGGGDPELMCHEPYLKLISNRQEREKVVGSPISSPLATYVAEGWISPRTLRPRGGAITEIPEHVRKYLDSSLSKDAEHQDSMETDDEEFETQEIEVVF